MAEERVSKRGRPVGTRTAVVELETASFKAPAELLVRVRAYAKEHRQSVSELVRDGLIWRIGEGDPLNMRYGTIASGETAYEGNTGNTDIFVVGEEALRGKVLDLLVEVRRYREEVRVSAQRSSVTQDVTPSSVTGNTNSASADGDIPVASMKAQSTLGQAPAGEDTREDIPPYDRAKHHLDSLCKRGHAWGNTGQSLRNADNQCLECRALAKREKDAKKRAKREAQPVAG